MQVDVYNEVSLDYYGGWKLCFQHMVNRHADGNNWGNYRFVWRRPSGETETKPARLPDAATILRLMQLAMEEGWLVSHAPTFAGKPGEPFGQAMDATRSLPSKM